MGKKSFDEFVHIKRPVQSPDGLSHDIVLKKSEFSPSRGSPLTVVERKHPLIFKAPPATVLDSNNDLLILQLLEYAGVYYLTPDCPAACQGVEIFRAGRTFALESAPEWVGVDWDYTTNIYKIYGPLPSLVAMKLFRTTPSLVQRKSIRLFEAAKPGMHELIMGMMVGYALRQGLRTFDQWEYYRPRVRAVTQTWPDRLAQLGTHAIRLVPLMMGRYPGKAVTEADVRASEAFITVDDFLKQITSLLTRFQQGNFKFHLLAPREQDEVMELLQVGKAYKLKPLSTFTAKGWMPPSLVFDDSPSSNARLLKEGVRVVGTLNPLVPGKDISDVRVLSFRGRKAAAREMVKMASRTEGPAMIDALQRLRSGQMSVTFTPNQLAPTPAGTLFVLHDISGSISDLLIKFREPQGKINRLIHSIIHHAGGLTKLKSAYASAASLRHSHPKNGLR